MKIILPILGIEREELGIIPVIVWEYIIIESNTVTSNPIFSPLSGGKLNPIKLINEISTHGKNKFRTKYNFLLLRCISNMTNGYLSGQQS